MKNLFFGGLFKYKDEGLLILRILIGLALVYHGYIKFDGGTAKLIKTGAALQYFGITGGYLFMGTFAALVEVVGGIFTAIGFMQRLSAFLMVGTLFVATTMVMITKGYDPASHAMDDMFVYIGLLISGPGKYSIDYKLAGTKE